MATGREKLLEILEKKYPKMFLRTTEEFNGNSGGIWSSGEDGLLAKDGFPMFEYYAEDYNEKRYVFGVHKEIRELLEKNGWFAEWNDPGTIMFWKEF
jgi:hypothetical protein